MKLADANLLIAYKWADHPQHAKARNFFASNPQVVTCPLTELAMLRILMHLAKLSGADADKALADFVSKHRGQFIADDISGTEMAGLNQGHRHVTDTYLVKLAQKHGIKIATLDHPFSQRFPKLIEFVG